MDNPCIEIGGTLLNLLPQRVAFIKNEKTLLIADLQAGHLHPGVKLSGKGRQAITLPCFYFGRQYGLLSAFGNFTGMAKLAVKRDDRVFIIIKEKVMEMAHD